VDDTPHRCRRGEACQLAPGAEAFNRDLPDAEIHLAPRPFCPGREERRRRELLPAPEEPPITALRQPINIGAV